MSGDIQVGKLVAGLSMDTSNFSKGITNAAGAMDGFKKTINTVKTALISLMTNPVVLAAAAIAAMVAAAKAAWDAWKEFDAAYDAIVVGTGATGEALEGLKDSFDYVFANATYAESMENLAGVVADLNTYLGVTGDQLNNLAIQFSNLEGIGASASVAEFSQTMNKWGIEAEKTSQYLDYFLKVSQDTGISIDTLSSSLASNKATLDLFGFSLEESASLIGAMNKAGFDSSTLQTGLRQLVNQGITTREGFDKLVSSIKNAKDETEAAALSMQAFGSRAGTEMMALIQSGLLDDIGGGFEDIGGYINQTAEETASFEQKMDLFGRRFKENFAKAGAVVEELLLKLFNVFEWVGSLGTKLVAPLQKLFTKIGESFSKFWNEGEDQSGEAVENIMTFLETLVDKIAEGVDWFLEFVYPMIEKGIALIVDVIKLFCAVFAGDWETVWDKVQSISKKGVSLIYTILELGWNAVVGGLESALQWMVDAIFTAINSVLGFIQDRINGIIDMVNSLIGKVNEVTGETFNFQKFEHVKLTLGTPQVELPEFADTGIAQRLNDYINSDNLTLEQAGFTQTINVTVNGDVTDPYTTSKEIGKQATNLATSGGYY